MFVNAIRIIVKGWPHLGIITGATGNTVIRDTVDIDVFFGVSVHHMFLFCNCNSYYYSNSPLFPMAMSSLAATCMTVI